MGREREVYTDIDYEAVFEEHKGLVYYFANNNPVNFIDKEDYIQLLLMKFWELIQKFNWNKYNDKEKQLQAFRGYIKQGLTRYMWGLGREFAKGNNLYSLDQTLSNNEEISLIDLLEDNSCSKDESYYLFKLQELINEKVVDGFLLDYIYCGNLNEVARKRGCSRSKARREIKREITILKKYI